MKDYQILFLSLLLVGLARGFRVSGDALCYDLTCADGTSAAEVAIDLHGRLTIMAYSQSGDPGLFNAIADGYADMCDRFPAYESSATERTFAPYTDYIDALATLANPWLGWDGSQPQNDADLLVAGWHDLLTSRRRLLAIAHRA